MLQAEREQLIAAYGRAPELLADALQRFPRTMWQYRSQVDPWTIHEIIVHIADSEANSYIRCRRCIAEPGSSVTAYDESRWARELHYHQQRPEEALALFTALRGSTYALIQNLPEPVWSQRIEHPENGSMTLDAWLLVYERHVPEHISQMQRIYEAWQQEQPDQPHSAA